VAILIMDQDVDQLIQTLVEQTGESITDAVKTAVRERLERISPKELERAPLTEDEIYARKRRLADLIDACAAMPTVDDRTPDQIIGYNEFGHFD
jgi:antitoxin VapB